MNELIFRCGFHDVQESDLEGKHLCQFELRLSQFNYSNLKQLLSKSLKVSSLMRLSCHANMQLFKLLGHGRPLHSCWKTPVIETLPGCHGRRRLPVSPVLLLGLLRARYWSSNCVQTCPSSVLQWDWALAQVARGFLRCSGIKKQEHLRRSSKKC